MPVTSIIQSAAAGGFDPADLFSGGEQGAWFDPSDISTLWQDTAGTIPVTADGDAVARIDDKSGNGNHLVQATLASRPLYKTDGTLHWLLFDGIDDDMSFADVVELRGAGGLFVNTAILSSSTGWNPGVSGMWPPSGSGASNWGLLANQPGNSAVGEFLMAANFGTVGVQTSGDVTNGAAHVFGGIYDLSNVIIGLDGTWTTGGSVSTTQNSSRAVFVGRYGPGLPALAMRFYGYIIVDRAPASSGERDDVDSYLAGKCGATL